MGVLLLVGAGTATATQYAWINDTLRRDVALHGHLVAYWSILGVMNAEGGVDLDPDEDAVFAITPQMRRIWLDCIEPLQLHERLSLLEPARDARDVDEREPARPRLVEARCDSPEALEVVEGDLDEIALPVQLAVLRDRALSFRLRADHGLDAARSQRRRAAGASGSRSVTLVGRDPKWTRRLSSGDARAFVERLRDDASWSAGVNLCIDAGTELQLVANEKPQTTARFGLFYSCGNIWLGNDEHGLTIAANEWLQGVCHARGVTC